MVSSTISASTRFYISKYYFTSFPANLPGGIGFESHKIFPPTCDSIAVQFASSWWQTPHAVWKLLFFPLLFWALWTNTSICILSAVVKYGQNSLLKALWQVVYACKSSIQIKSAANFNFVLIKCPTCRLSVWQEIQINQRWRSIGLHPPYQQP